MQKIALDDEANIPLKFSFSFVGRTERCNEILNLVGNNGDKLRVLPNPRNITKKPQLWHLLPMVNSTGIISSVQVLGSSSIEIEQSDSGRCVLTGKILQVSKRTSVVLFSVELSKEKLFTVTLANPDPRMKPGQIWSITAHLADNKLAIVEALPITLIEPEREKQPQQQKPVEIAVTIEPVAPKNNAPTEKAIDALKQQTEINDWSLSQPVLRAQTWEWSATSPQTGLKARVAINGDRTLLL